MVYNVKLLITDIMEEKEMIYGIRDKPPLPEWILLSLQRLCAIFGATMLVLDLGGATLSIIYGDLSVSISGSA